MFLRVVLTNLQLLLVLFVSATFSSLHMHVLGAAESGPWWVERIQKITATWKQKYKTMAENTRLCKMCLVECVGKIIRGVAQ